VRIVGWYWQTCYVSDKVPALTDPPEGYASWLADLEGRIHAQQRAALAVPLTTPGFLCRFGYATATAG
jgi:hypothetical protein